MKQDLLTRWLIFITSLFPSLRTRVPLQLTNPFPWSPTTAFPHPLVDIASSNLPTGLTNVLSYALSENFTWLGLSDMTNTFRTKTLGLAPLSFRSGPSLLDRLKVRPSICSLLLT